MGKTLYFECDSGISGDMSVAALLDLGADRNRLEKVLESVPVKGFSIRISTVKKAGIDCTDFDVIVDKEYENHDHDMEYLYGHEHVHETHHEHEEHGHDHDDHHDHDHEHHHHHEHRGLEDVKKIIAGTDMSDKACRQDLLHNRPGRS